MSQLLEAVGIDWTYEGVRSLVAGGPGQSVSVIPDRVRIPLALTLDKTLRDRLCNVFKLGKYAIQDQDGNMVDMSKVEQAPRVPRKA